MGLFARLIKQIGGSTKGPPISASKPPNTGAVAPVPTSPTIPPVHPKPDDQVRANSLAMAESLYHKAAWLILVGTRLHEEKRIRDGIELLLQCENLAPTFLDPLKLSYRVMWSRMPAEDRERTMFVDRHRHPITEKVAFLDRVKAGLESFEEHPDQWQDFVVFAEGLLETRKIRQDADELRHKAEELINESRAGKGPPQLLLPRALRSLLEAVKTDPENLDAWKLYCKLTYSVYEPRKRAEVISEERRFAKSEENSIKLQFLDELVAGKHPLGESEQAETAESACSEATRLHLEGKQGQAIDKLKLAVKLDPQHIQAQIAAAWAFSELEQWDSSVLHANNALSLAKEEQDIHEAQEAAFTTYCGKANQLQSQERYREAMVFFKKAVFLDPKNKLAEAAFNRMWLIEAKPDCREFFIETCRDALTRCPGWNRVRFWLGRALMNLMDAARSQEALPYLEEAVRGAPNELDGHEWLFLAYTGSKEFAKARKEFEVLKRLNSKNVEQWAILVRDENGPPVDDTILRRFFGLN
jgi:tetratricopeptide (TPR) repeat protein